MKLDRRIGTAIALAIWLAATTCVGCGGNSIRSANIQASDMPEGESWSGVYYHPVFGYLHMVEQDTNIVGRWRRTDKSAWGELSGTKVGNVFHFAWKEHRTGLVGPSAMTRGKGYFVYKLGTNGIAELDGEYGLGSDETGSDWHSVKQQRVVPDLNSVSGDNSGTALPPGQRWE